MRRSIRLPVVGDGPAYFQDVSVDWNRSSESQMLPSKSAGGIESLPNTVVRIEAGDIGDNTLVHYGTGFYYSIVEGKQNLPLIVSNKHVLCNRSWIELSFSRADENGDRVLGPPLKCRIDSKSIEIFEHPDPNVDLAALPLVPIIEHLEKNGARIYCLQLTKSNFVDSDSEKLLHAATSVLMVGFPNGLMDVVNNLPLVRRGILATPYVADYCGKTDFVVDIASFGGSSGSPVFAYLEGVVPGAGGTVQIRMKPDIRLIGVLHSGPVYSTHGQIIQHPVPTSTYVAETQLMMHLGFCVKAHRVRDFESILFSHLKAKSS